MEYIKPAIIGTGIGTIVYALYVQFSPGMGNIWIRRGVDNKYVFAPNNLLNLIIEPFFNKDMWQLSTMDLNYFAYVAIGGIIGIVYHYFDS